MRLSLVAVTIAALLLIACNGPGKPTADVGPENTPVETPEVTEPSPAAVTPTPSPENTLLETPEYTGVIVTKEGASEFGYLFDSASTEFWEPSIDDVSSAEACIRDYLVSVQNDPNLDAYQQGNLAFILENLETYRRQYVGTVVDGQKRIWVNSFFSADSFPEWKRVPVDVDGGGRHYWQIEYDPLNDECINFRVHGES